MFDNPLIPRKFVEIIRYSAFAGFIVSATLLVLLDYKAFKRVFKERVNELKWVFVISTVVILLLMIYIFTIFFQRLGLQF
jgi:hypothetical protein